jgi:sulfur relay (sulfurtransferase) complex TusBCD TusD component (DsrE family)
MKIGVLLCSSPESEDGFTVGQLAGGLLSAGHEVSLFLMDDGVYHAAASSVQTGGIGYSSLGLPRLIEQGARVSLCAVTAKARGLGEAQLLPKVALSSQYELSHLVKDADRFLAFG